jgi:hypothetical protein
LIKQLEAACFFNLPFIANVVFFVLFRYDGFISSGAFRPEKHPGRRAAPVTTAISG